AVTPKPADEPGPVAVTPPAEPEPATAETEPAVDVSVDREPGEMESDDEDVRAIRPVTVAPIDMNPEESVDVDVAVAEPDKETSEPGSVEPAPRASATAPPVSVPAPRHSMPMPEEVLVTPDGYEVEYD
ncbi:MAG: hypothetical protein KGY81_08470, partial [Phycisphaerae bacterium]|nr:hypothetical protein [Phycisphaerae bacterium]